MRIFISFLIPAIFSCASPSNKPNLIVQSDWILSDNVRYDNAYRADGLLEKTYRTTYHFFQGQLILVYKDIITKDYDDKKNLISKKTFSENLKELSAEEVWEYDANGNLLSHILKTDGFLDHSEKNIYNKNNQRIKYINIYRTYEDEKNWNHDSVLDGKKHSPRIYDTFIVNYRYDPIGNLIQPKYDTIEDVNTRSSFDSTKNGDTLITNLKTPLDTLTQWYLNRLLIKSTSHHSKTNDRELYLYRYNQKGDETEELHYISVKQ